MAHRLFNLRYVPDDEADEVRALLENADIAYTETHAGMLGLGSAAIWVLDENELEKAKLLLQHYQEERANQARAQFQQAHELGDAPNWRHRAREQPLRFILFLLGLALILFISLGPYFGAL